MVGAADGEIVPYRDGPYLVRGPVVLRDQSGRPIETPGRGTFALCRCGKSRIRPFCDGTHQLVHFRSASEQEARGQAAGEGGDRPPRPAPRARPEPATGSELAAIARELDGLRGRIARAHACAGQDSAARLPAEELDRLLVSASGLLRGVNPFGDVDSA